MPLTRIAAAALAALSLACSGGGPPPVTVARAATDPAEAEFVTEDLERFWDVFDRGGTATLFEQEYLARASPGLLDFRGIRSLTSLDLARMVAAHPLYLRAIRDRSRGLGSSGVTERIRDAYRELKRLYPAAVFPPVTFLVGRFSTMGTVASSGILVGAEFYGADRATPLDELASFQRANVHTIDELPWVVSHELVHVLQARARRSVPSRWTLLQQAFMEGSADFVGELASGGNINRRAVEFGLQDEHALWGEFRAEMDGEDVSRWLYNQASPPAGRPGDLGYFFGYRIAQAYYDRATDKAAAVADIIAASDAGPILEASEYAP